MDAHRALSLLEGYSQDDQPPEILFHRQWALALLGQALLRLRKVYARTRKEEVFERLAGCLPGVRGGAKVATAAAALGVNAQLIQFEASSLSMRFSKAVRTEMALLGCTPEETKEEIGFVIKVVEGNETGDPWKKT